MAQAVLLGLVGALFVAFLSWKVSRRPTRPSDPDPSRRTVPPPAARPPSREALVARLYERIAENDESGVAQLLRSDIDLNCGAPPGREPVLCHAAQESSPAIVAALLRSGATPDVRTAKHLGQAQPIHLAATRGSAPMLSELLAFGADVDARDSNGRTALVRSVQVCEYLATEVLLSAGADASLHDERGKTAEGAARDEVEAGHLEWHWILALLSPSLTADPEFATARRQALEGTPDERLLEAVRSGVVEDVERALAAGGSPNAYQSDEQPLGLACSRGQTELAQLLLERGAHFDESLVHAIARSPGDATDLLELWLDRGVDVDDRSPGGGAGTAGGSPLHAAARAGRVARCRLLLARGSTVNRQDLAGATPLHAAVLGGQAEVVALLLESGADLSIQRSDGGTALHDAVWGPHRSLECVRRLLESGADPTQRDGSTGQTPLDVARAHGNEEAVRVLEDANGVDRG